MINWKEMWKEQTMILEPQPLDQLYPSTDGVEMGESNPHYDLMTYLCENFRYLFAQQKVSVHANLFWYPVLGNPEIRRAPDIMIIFDCEFQANRSSYVQGLHNNQPPGVVIEILSRSNTEGTMQERRDWYEKYGVSEYYEIDDVGETVRVWLLEEGSLVEQTGIRSFTSPLTGCTIDWTSGIEFTMPNGKKFVTVQEIREQRDEAIREARKQAQRAEQAELQAKQAALQAKQAQLQAKQAALQAEQERQQALAEKQRADELQRQLDELRRKMEP
jgi:Uma2 family endonuclease